MGTKYPVWHKPYLYNIALLSWTCFWLAILYREFYKHVMTTSYHRDYLMTNPGQAG